MAIKVRFGGVWQTITGGQVFSGGAWRSLVAVQVYSGGAWRQVGNFTPPGTGGGGGGALSLSLSTTAIGGRAGTGATAMTTSNSATVTPSGGLAPYSYAWSVVSSDGQATYTIDSSTLSTTTATATSLGGPLPSSCGCTIHCVVTDSLGATATSDIVNASFATF
jgi:hypothetical protein